LNASECVTCKQKVVEQVDNINTSGIVRSMMRVIMMNVKMILKCFR